jgi:hypothetical protein
MKILTLSETLTKREELVEAVCERYRVRVNLGLVQGTYTVELPHFTDVGPMIADLAVEKLLRELQLAGIETSHHTGRGYSTTLNFGPHPERECEDSKVTPIRRPTPIH